MKKTLALALVLSLSAGSAHSASKWWWETYTARNTSTTLQGSGNISTTQNPTGSNAGINKNAATQPPTVIIQATTSTTGLPTMTCVNTTQSPGAAYSYNQYVSMVAVCPSAPGFTVFQINNDVYNQTYVTTTSTWKPGATAACCYIPQTTATSGIAYTPWSDLTSSGYSGTLHQEWGTPGATSFTVPAGVYKVWVTVTGGGGGGSGNGYRIAGYYYQNYGGGGGGTVYRYPLAVLPGATLGVYVGAGGKVGSAATGWRTGGAGWLPSDAYSPTGGGGGSSAVVYQQTVVAGGGGGGGSAYNSASYYTCGGGGGGASGNGPAAVTGGSCSSGGSGFGSSSGTGPSSSNGTGTAAGSAGSPAGASSPSGAYGGGGGAVYYGGGHGGGWGVGKFTGEVYTGAYGASGAGGGGYGADTYYGGANGFTPGSGGRATWGVMTIDGNNYYGGAGGAGGFLGMPWTAVSIPAGGQGGTCGSAVAPYVGGAGGYGFGAGGGSAVGAPTAPRAVLAATARTVTSRSSGK